MLVIMHACLISNYFRLNDTVPDHDTRWSDDPHVTAVNNNYGRRNYLSLLLVRIGIYTVWMWVWMFKYEHLLFLQPIISIILYVNCTTYRLLFEMEIQYDDDDYYKYST